MSDSSPTPAAAPSRPRIHFVTGRLAEHALREQLLSLSAQAGFDYTVEVLPITVAALMTMPWIAARIEVPPDTDRVILPGYCLGDVAVVQARAGSAEVVCGPRDLRELPEFFGQAPKAADLTAYSIQILAEINHAPRLSRAEILNLAQSFRSAGADVIDVGCDPGGPWTGVADCIRMLRDVGCRVSIDSLDPREIAPAVAAGAELVLSVNSRNRQAALDWGCEVVAIPDEPANEASLRDTIEFLAGHGVPLRIDPILEPIGCGFAASLGRYLQTRALYPDAEMMMGIGNLTELTDCDSAPINLLLLGICQELSIHSVLTTQVIPWANTSVRECDLARRLVHHAVRRRAPPKRVDERLVLLRDARVHAFGAENIERLATDIRDHNYRIFAEQGEVHLVSAGLHLHDSDPFELLTRLMRSGPDGGPPKNLDASHAFYLGYEAAKAVTALTLGKQYRQDEPLDWGFLTRPEVSHRPSARGTPTAAPGPGMDAGADGEQEPLP